MRKTTTNLTLFSKIFTSKKKNKESTIDLEKVEIALKKVNDGYNELTKLGLLKKKGKIKLTKIITVVTAIISILFGYQQYLERSLETRYDNLQQTFLFAVRSLESNSEAVRSTGVKTLESVAFTELLVEPKSGILAPPQNLLAWLMNKKEMRLLERSRVVFQDFSKINRKDFNGIYNPVSTAIVEVGLTWIEREARISGKHRNDESLWFFYGAKLCRANSPSKAFDNMMFGDVDFSHSLLSETSFKDTHLTGSNFQQANLKSSNFSNAMLFKSNFNNSKMQFSILDNIVGKKSNFTGSDLTNAQLTHSNFEGAIFDKTILRTTKLNNSTFHNAKFQNIQFLNTDFENVDFENCRFLNVDFSQAKNFELVKSWKNAVLNNVKFSERQKELIKNKL